jgi:hypothetical protein
MVTNISTILSLVIATLLAVLFYFFTSTSGNAAPCEPGVARATFIMLLYGVASAGACAGFLAAAFLWNAR